MESTIPAVPRPGIGDELPLELFELTSEGFEIESLTGVGQFTGRCCPTGATCNKIGDNCFC